MSCPAMAQLFSNTLYYKRFFPSYSFNVLGGLDNEGKRCVFSYDAVGSYERVGYSSQPPTVLVPIIMPFLDNQLKSPTPLLLPAKDAVTESLHCLKQKQLIWSKLFLHLQLRDIYTGDKLGIVILNASGICRKFMDLRKDLCFDKNVQLELLNWD